ncbi:restriction endonuclease subunit S [Enterobacter cloacae]|uniref:restriction endonuclease subunit S n=1 Tax=Enterobacter cloacae TaxID=550 RepID=UPI000665A243|nr:restriction endonuclease subunit S [Enterobacter cloacae]SSH72156.1 restriction endonuclease subunit S [Klebsiella pneumoniae]MCK6713352.1 restriction endonuclease subunit S [Enterobacter cloacae]NBG17224.1 restriction endonuclease subunit S [Enterobacter cloacae]WIF63098.1 restriction endonuclease subunit S [Enterobacter cloacae]HAS1006441.1 restriction endonuclease subunit S [Enterobacter cloacae]
MAKYKAYPEYKDSGVEWLGEVPNHWKTVSISRLFSRVKRTGYKEKELLSVYRDYGVIPKSSRDDNNNKPSEDLSPYQLVQSNDLVMNKMKAWQGSIAISECEGIVSPAYFVYQPNNSLFELAHPKYVHYLLRNPIYVTQYLSRSKGIRVNQWDLDPDEFRNIEILLPSKVEQEKIYSFLDHETAKIDKLIEKQQQLIELLKEKRQAVISHAVTKGLNPDVPMKDSGVEWLGEVPEHWSLKSFRYACLIYRGKFGHRPRNDPSLYDGDYPFIQTGDVARASKFIETYSQTLNEKGKAVSQLFPSGTLMMAIAANIGDTAILGFEAYAPDSVVGFKPYQNLHLEFLRYSFMAALPALEQTSTQSTQANLNIDRIGAVKAVFPSLEEQLDIIDYLDNMLCSYDSIEENANQAIQLLQERRTALISAAVTGKIDVRDWVAPETQDVEEPQEAAA